MPEKLPRTLIIIPALNEAANIARVVAQLQAHVPQSDILVINDGSRDDTARIARGCGAFVLDMPYNVGIGAAVQTGFKFAAQQGYTVVLRSDGDGQHDPQDMQRLLAALLEDQADMVVGSRFLDAGDSQAGGYRPTAARRAGIVILARLISLINHQRITDPTSGFAAFNARAVRLFAAVYPHDYPEPEALVVAHRAGLRVREVAVTMHARGGGKSSITTVRSVYYMLKVILAILINLLRAPALAADRESQAQGAGITDKDE